MPLLVGHRETGREYFYFHGAGVRKGKWKYLKPKAHFYGYAIEDDREEVEELYDLESDVGEQNNLAAKFPEKVVVLRALMEKLESLDGSQDPAAAKNIQGATADRDRAKQ